MINRRDIVAIGAAVAVSSIAGSGQATATTVVKRGDHHPEASRGKIQSLLKMIGERDFEAYFESGLTTDIYHSLGPANNKDDYLAFAKDFTESDSRRDRKPIEVRAMRTVCRDQYSASYLCQLQRSRYFKNNPDDLDGMIEPLKAGFYDVSDSWLVSFEADRIVCFRELPELMTSNWYSTSNG